MNAFLCAVMLVRRSYPVFEVAYFWAMAGSVAAMLTPQLAEGFPHPSFVAFFTAHGLGSVAVVLAIFAHGFRPRLRSLGRALLVKAGYAGLVGAVNLALGTNYLFLRAKPASPTMLDLLGPAPIYRFGLAALTVTAFLIVYAPFARRG